MMNILSDVATSSSSSLLQRQYPSASTSSPSSGNNGHNLNGSTQHHANNGFMHSQQLYHASLAGASVAVSTGPHLDTVEYDEDSNECDLTSVSMGVFELGLTVLLLFYPLTDTLAACFTAVGSDDSVLGKMKYGGKAKWTKEEVRHCCSFFEM
jgi:hypothetical protein